MLKSSPKKKNSNISSTSSISDVVVVFDSPKVSDSIILVKNSKMSNESEYGFDALHTDDSTDDEEIDNVINRPYWSQSNNRNAIVIDQTGIDDKIVENFFGSKAEKVDAMEIFPKSVPEKRRRSTAIWKTPPRYSVLPKY